MGPIIYIDNVTIDRLTKRLQAEQPSASGLDPEAVHLWRVMNKHAH